MPYPSDGGGSSGGGSGATAAVPDILNPLKTIRYEFDFQVQGLTAIPPPFAMSALNSGTQTTIAADGANHVGIWNLYSSTSAASGISCNISASHVPVTSIQSMTVYFKTPPVLDANTLITIGNFANGVGDRSGFSIIGNAAQAIVITGGSPTATGSTYTLAADTWYIAKIEYQGSSKMTCTLFDDNGISLYTYTANTALYTAGTIGLRAQNSGTTAMQLCKIDYIDIIVPVAGRAAV
jgi:hypothetical protein